MKPLLTLCAVLLLLLTPTAHAQTDSDTPRKELQAMYNKIAANYRKRDTKAAWSVATPDFLFTDGKNKAGRADLEKMTAQEFAAMESLKKFEITIENVTVTGNTATALTRGHLIATMKDTKGVLHTFEDVVQSYDTWIKTPTGWRMKRIEALSDTMKMDGKPYIPYAPASK